MPAARPSTMTLYRRPPLRWEWLAVLGILLLAALMRLGQPGMVEFKRDEASLSRLALNLINGADVPLLGIGSSVGFPNAPVNVYLFAIPYAVSSNPLLATLFVGFLNVLAVALLWKMTRRYFGPQAALVAGLFFALSPWAAIYSRKIWAQDLLPPFVIATVFTATLGFLEKHPRRWAQLLHLPLLAFTLQIHFAAVVLVPLSLLLLLFGWRNIRREAWFSFGLAFLVCVPYLYGLHDAGLLSPGALIDSVESGPQEGPAAEREFSTTAWEYTWFLVAGKDIHSLAGEKQFLNYLDSVPDAYPWFNLVSWAVLLSAVLLSFLAIRHRKSRSLYAFLLVWLCLPTLAFSYTWTVVHPHYFIPMLPAAFIVLGAGVAQTNRFVKKIWEPALVVGGTAMAAILLLQGWLFMSLLDFLDEHDTSGAFGTPLHYLLDVREAILDENPASVLVVSNGDSVQFDNAPAVWDVLLDEIEEVRFVDGERFWILPQQDSFTLVSPHLKSELAARFPPTEPELRFDLRPGEGQYRLWKESPALLPGNSLVVNARYKNEVRLERLWRSDEAVWLAWRLPDTQPDALYFVFIHAIQYPGDGTEVRLDQSDQPFLGSEYWQPNDRVVFRAPLSFAEAEVLRIGMYTLLEDNRFKNSELLDENGAYLGQALEITLEEIPHPSSP